jgi:hypothetical protein
VCQFSKGSLSRGEGADRSPATRHGSERVGLESVNLPMAIDKDSNGVPEVDVSRRTTKVNLWMIVAVAVFFIITGIIVFNFAR